VTPAASVGRVVTPDLDVLVLGSGVAGLSAAVRAASAEPGVRVGVLTKAELSQSATRWAQGGVAAVLDGDEDSTDLHLADTLRAGAGLCDVDAVRVLVDEGPARVQELIGLGAVFDTDAGGQLLLAREGGHSLPRIVHAGGAATGVEIERALVDAVHATAALVVEHGFALDFVVEGGRCRGVRARMKDGSDEIVRAEHTLLATGGAGQLFAVTTNPAQATGDGIAMALRAGVAVADVEFMQFHPTALHHPAMPRPLLSEALRGHGALIRDTNGARFVEELQPRDVVARAITARMLELGTDHCFLDATGLEQFDERFPTIAAAVREIGLDPTTDWLPIAPAAHYLSGGILTDLDGATTLPGLWAAGEAACAGVHGANRLASNSLLDGMVFAARVVEAIVHGKNAAEATGAMRAVLGCRDDETCIGGITVTAAPVGGRHGREPADKVRERLQRAMTDGAGVLRSARSLAETRDVLDELALDDAENRNLATVAGALLCAATKREESRGAHSRTDHPASLDSFVHRLVVSQS
jgi:L-aspartate oxidase